MNNNNAKASVNGFRFVLVVFLALIATIMVAPKIYNTFYGIKAPDTPVVIESVESTVQNKEQAVSAYVSLDSSSVVTFNGITFSEFKLYGNTLEFSVKSSEEKDLSKLEYYLEFYKNKKVFIARRELEGKSSIENTRYSVDVSNINIDSETFLVISHISSSSIPFYKFVRENNDTLYCTSNNYRYSYKFNGNELLAVTYKYTHSSSSLNDYSNKKIEYQKIVNEYNNYANVTASIIDNTERANTFDFLVEFNYSTADSIDEISDSNIFKKGVKLSYVKFKMESRGYECDE